VLSEQKDGSTNTENIDKLEAVGQCIPAPKHVLQVSRYITRLLPKFNHLFIGPQPTFSENFMQISSEVFAAKLLTDKQTTHPPWRRNWK